MSSCSGRPGREAPAMGSVDRARNRSDAHAQTARHLAVTSVQGPLLSQDLSRFTHRQPLARHLFSPLGEGRTGRSVQRRSASPSAHPAEGRSHRSRSPIEVFTTPIQLLTMTDRGVHDSDRAVHLHRSRVFTLTDLGVHVGPKCALYRELVSRTATDTPRCLPPLISPRSCARHPPVAAATPRDTRAATYRRTRTTPAHWGALPHRPRGSEAGRPPRSGRRARR
jgi:hypothetical protein